MEDVAQGLDNDPAALVGLFTGRAMLESNLFEIFKGLNMGELFEILDQEFFC